MRRQLVDHSVGQRVAERHAQFQHIHPGAVEGQCQFAGRLQIGVTRANVNNKSRPALFLQAGKPFDNAIHPGQNGNNPASRWRGAWRIDGGLAAVAVPSVG